MKRFDYGSALNGGHLAKGCEYCIRGSKMVLFITGRCNTGCFYCPVSPEKKGKDVIYANEKKISFVSEIIEEAESMDAEGTGITGGDPLIMLPRTLEMIQMLKSRFGEQHHIHLYTSIMDPKAVELLIEAGLDEIRFHPGPEKWSSMEDTPLKEIVGMDIDVGIEVPAIPGMEEDLNALIGYATSVGVDFINLNELEFSESNWDMMGPHGFEVRDETSARVAGSKEVAISLMRRNRRSPIHFCSSVFKDGTQLRNRLVRRALHIARDYEVVTEDGTLIKGIIETDDEAFIQSFGPEYGLTDAQFDVNTEMGRIEMSSKLLKKIASTIEYPCYEIEEYATADSLEVERTPLNRSGPTGL